MIASIALALGLADKTKNSELILAIAELNLELANSKLSLANLMTEIAQLKTDNEALKTKIQRLKERTTEKLVQKKGLYYTESDDGPFCTACYDSNQKKIRVAEMPSAMQHLVANYRNCLLRSVTLLLGE